MELLNRDWDALQNSAEMFLTRQAEIIALDSEFAEELPQLYVNEPVRVVQDVACQRPRGEVCAGPAHFDFEVSQQRVVAFVRTKITDNRRSTEKLLSTRALPDGVCRAGHHLKRVIQALLKEIRVAPTGREETEQVARGVFYHLVERINARTQQFPPTKILYAELTHLIGNACIVDAPDQVEHVLTLLIDTPEHSSLIGPLLNPNACPDRFAELHMRATQQFSTDNEAQNLIVMRRFRVKDWLVDSRPVLTERYEIWC